MASISVEQFRLHFFPVGNDLTNISQHQPTSANIIQLHLVHWLCRKGRAARCEGRTDCGGLQGELYPGLCGAPERHPRLAEVSWILKNIKFKIFKDDIPVLKNWVTHGYPILGRWGVSRELQICRSTGTPEVLENEAVSMHSAEDWSSVAQLAIGLPNISNSPWDVLQDNFQAFWFQNDPNFLSTI